MKKILMLLISVILLLSSCSVIDEGNETTVTTDPPYIPTPEEVWGVEVPETALFELPYPNESFLNAPRVTSIKANEMSKSQLNQSEFLNQYGSGYVLRTYQDEVVRWLYIQIDDTGKDCQWLLIVWDTNGNYDHSVFFELSKMSLVEYLVFEKGDTMRDVRNLLIDTGDFWNSWYVPNYLLPLDDGGVGKFSSHVTADGFKVTIMYRLSDKVSESSSHIMLDDYIVYDIIVEEY